jgi:hypothetical protein
LVTVSVTMRSLPLTVSARVVIFSPPPWLSCLVFW